MASGIYGVIVFLITFFSYIILWCLLSRVDKYKKQKAKAVEYKQIDGQEFEDKLHNENTTEQETTTAAVPVAFEYEAQHPLDNMNTIESIKFMLISPIFWVVCLMLSCYYAIFDLPVYIPMYLNEVKKNTPADAARASLAFSLGPAITILVAGFIYDLLSRVRTGRFMFIAVNQIIVVLCAVSIWFVPTLSTTITMILLFFLAACSSPGFYLSYSIFCVNFGGARHTAKVVSFTPAIASLILIGYSYVMGLVMQQLGWSAFWLIIMIVCIMSGVLATTYEAYAMAKTKATNTDEKTTINKFL